MSNKPKRKRWTPWKPGDPPRPMGRPRSDGTPPVQRKDPTRSAAGARPEKPAPAACDRPLPVAPDGHDLEIFKWAGQRVPLIYIARGRGIPIEDLQDGGRYWETVCLGILAYAAHAADSIYLKACSLTGNPIPGIHWGKCNLKMRETGENETEVKKVRQIKRVTFRTKPALQMIKGGVDGSDADGGGKPIAGGRSGDGNSGKDGSASGVDSQDSGDSRG